MNILYVCHRFPYPPKRGGKIRPFNMIRHFSENHRVTVCSLARREEEAVEGAGIAPYCHRFELVTVSRFQQRLRMVSRLPTRTPSSMGYFYSAELDRRIQKLLATEKFDLIFVHCSSVAQYVASVQGIPKILDFGDMDSQKWLEYSKYKPFPLSLGYWMEGKKLVAEEQRLAKCFDLCTATTRAEWETLESYQTGVATGWFPNGVDSSYFKPDPTPIDANTLTFVGRMDYYPNQQCMFDFCRDVFPKIRARRPQAELLIVGADPIPSIRELGRIPGVTVTGSVPDVRPYLRKAAAMVAPLSIARGTQNKILEAMAMGVPVVTSSKAAGGVDAVAGEHFLVADSPTDVAQACLSLMDNPASHRALAIRGRERMLSHHAWPGSMNRLDALVTSCVNNFQRKPESGRLA